jgi:hypothetical protein
LNVKRITGKQKAASRRRVVLRGMLCIIRLFTVSGRGLVLIEGGIR